MKTRSPFIATVLALALTVLGAANVSAAPNTASSQKGCAIWPTNAARTVNALMHKCSTEEILTLFANAPLGQPPTGKRTISLLPLFQINGKALPYDTAGHLTRAQSQLGKTLTFTTRGGRPWVYKDYITGRDIGAPLIRSVSRIDQKPVYAADFSRDFYGYRISLHEYRQLTPKVWIGRDIGGGDGPTDTPTGGAIALS